MTAESKPRRPQARKLLISDQLRESIADFGSQYELAQVSGVNAANIHRFMKHERGLTLDTLDRLATAIGLKLVETGRPASRPARKAITKTKTGRIVQAVETDDPTDDQ